MGRVKMNKTFVTTKRQLLRQIAHWEGASASQGNLEQTASPQAWASLERYMGVALRKHLAESVDQLVREAAVVRAMYNAIREAEHVGCVCREIEAFRMRYLRTKTLVDFFGHAVNTRTNEELSMTLRALDVLATRSMSLVLEPLGRAVPPVLTYLDKGLGASILKAGLRLWDGSVSPVATVKVTYHNRWRPTALLHEAGYQVAHLLNWNYELSSALSKGVKRTLGEVCANWASEIATDCFAFVHAGFASLAALSDVVGGDSESVFRWLPSDPHPISYIRVLLGVEMRRQFYGRGPGTG
jgi:hypothetical protein